MAGKLYSHPLRKKNDFLCFQSCSKSCILAISSCKMK
nr:MAG TPA: hypothetical protein [Caudoviricetes sp.]